MAADCALMCSPGAINRGKPVHVGKHIPSGNGVLVLDLSNTGKIDSPRQFEFTAWDPTAKTDMQALKDVFDTNHDGKLDAGDADWNFFKVMVTNPDGTTTLESLSQLGITSIDLTPNKNMIVLPDGSRIEGQTTFTKSDGTTGAAADVAPPFGHKGFVTQQTASMRYERIEALADFTIGEVKKIIFASNPYGGCDTARKTVLEITSEADDGSFRWSPRRKQMHGDREPALLMASAAKKQGPRWSGAWYSYGDGAFNSSDA
jgi:hypothetical protein